MLFYMKKLQFFVVAVLAIVSFPSFAQSTKYVGVEFLGASTGVGLRYDQRFSGNNGLGFSAAIAYAHGDDAAYSKGSGMDNILIPVEVNYLTGEGNSHFEAGLGMMNGRYHMPNVTSYGYYFYLNLGWRYQKPEGFMFRVGVSPSFGSGSHYVEKKAFFPYIGIGWSF